MYGFWRLGTIPLPSAGATCWWNGLETKQSMKLKKTAMSPKTGTVHAMSSRWLIVADDLTGAADCAIAFARRGRETAVTWGEVAEILDQEPAVLAYDAASRALSAEAAAERHVALLRRLAGPDRLLFKKIDSTLRGQPAAATAAALAHIRAASAPALGVLAPAFPATGRTTIEGRVLLHGVPLEATELWSRDHSYASADLVDMLASSGLRGQELGLAAVRDASLKSTLARLAGAGDVIAVCDAETDHDLQLIAKAGLNLSQGTFFIGSAGLAHALAGIETGRDAAPLHTPLRASGTLVVVGSLAEASRIAASSLAGTGKVVHVVVQPRTLLEPNGDGRKALAIEVREHLSDGRDVLLEIATSERLDLTIGAQLAHSLAATLQDVAPAIGAFAATGGETAAAILARFGVHGIRLADEIEPGVALGLTLGRLSVPIATKAGAFGDRHSLIRICERLRAVRTRGSFT